MMDRPTKEELIQAVRAYLTEQLMPTLDGADAFYVRVAANVLGIVEREERLAPEAETSERERLAALLGEEGDLDTLNRLLCEAIRSGAIAVDDLALREHLRETAMAKLAVDQPRYQSYKRAPEGG